MFFLSENDCFLFLGKKIDFYLEGQFWFFFFFFIIVIILFKN